MINFNVFTRKSFFLSLLSVAFIATSCSEDDSPAPTEPTTATARQFTLALSASPTGQTKVYTQAITDVSSNTTVSFDGQGFEMPSTRTARIFASKDGKSVYNLDYGGGRIYKFSVDGGQTYTQQFEKNIEFAMGTSYPRWTKASETSASVHYASGRNAVRVFDENDPTKFIRTDIPLRIMSVGLDNLSFGSIEEITIPVSETDLQPYNMTINGTEYAHYNHVSRVDAPVIAGDKIYYGLAKDVYTPALPNACETDDAPCPYPLLQNVETLVLDYPSLTNPKIISTDIARGDTNGYRTPVAHVDERGDVYQAISVPDNTYDTYILKISNGAYDEGYRFNLSEKLGFNVSTNGWFYAGNGIGYVPYANTDASEDWWGDSVWGVVRVDLYNNTAVKLNLPDLSLAQYQSAVVDGDKFYMALTPLGQEGNIYIFDVNSTSPNGFTKGATLQNLAEGNYIGIY